MDQDKVWDYFQTEGLEKFALSVPRLNFLLKRARKVAGERELKVLNIGVGDGWLERRCLAQGWDAYSLDPSKGAINRLTEAGVKGEVGHLEAIPYQDNSFDVVFCSEVIEHLSSKQIGLGLSEITRVLKNEGVLMGTVPFRENLFEGRVICPACGNVFHRIGHQQSFDLETLPAIFPASLRMEEVRATYFYDWATLNWKGKMLAVVKRGLLFVGVHGANENIYFAARKSPSAQLG